jgi:CubicO group peptidase (beta-lactamase class C family)
VFKPLEMAGTAVGTPAPDDPLAARPYNGQGNITPWWDADAILGAGGIRSTVADLLRLARANLDPSSTPIGPALALTHEPRIGSGERMEFGLGWVRLERQDGTSIIWHNGGTYGFHSFLGLHQPSQTAVVALANNGESNHDPAGFRVLSSVIEISNL